MGIALDQVKEVVSRLRNLPATAEDPEVSRIIRYEPVARLLVAGTEDLRQLRGVVRQIERELLGQFPPCSMGRALSRIELTTRKLPQAAVALLDRSASEQEPPLPFDHGRHDAQKHRIVDSGAARRRR